MRVALPACLFLLLLILPPLSSQGAEAVYRHGDFRLLGDSSNQANIGGGVFKFNEKGEAWAGLLEVRLGRKWSFLGPMVGIMGNTDGGTFVYAAGYADMLWKRIAVTPMIGAGAYFEGDSRDLGGTFQFRSGVNVGWRFRNDRRLGLHLAHVSNANLHNRNPGENEIMLTFSFPF